MHERSIVNTPVRHAEHSVSKHQLQLPGTVALTCVGHIPASSCVTCHCHKPAQARQHPPDRSGQQLQQRAAHRATGCSWMQADTLFLAASGERDPGNCCLAMTTVCNSHSLQPSAIHTQATTQLDPLTLLPNTQPHDALDLLVALISSGASVVIAKVQT